MTSHTQTGIHCKRFSHLQAEHDLAEEHVFQWNNCPGAVDGVVALKSLKEVRVGSFPIFLPSCMDDAWSERAKRSHANKTHTSDLKRSCRLLNGEERLAWLHIKSRLELWGTVNSIGGGPGWGEGSPGFGKVAESVVGFTLQQLNLHQQSFIVHLLQLL